jgi:Na+-transporting methylmalonyl-CoA/oxaloacetate decarboxylase gamma subunit
MLEGLISLMDSPLSISLVIAIIGLALVFFVILLLWGLLIGLVKITTNKTAEKPVVQPTEVRARESSAEVERAYQTEAAAAAVAIALVLQKSAPRKPESGSGISPWQAVFRARQLSQGSTSIIRKARGTK